MINKFERSKKMMKNSVHGDWHKFLEVPVSWMVNINSVEKVIELIDAFDEGILQDDGDYDQLCTDVEMMIDEGLIEIVADGIIIWNP